MLRDLVWISAGRLITALLALMAIRVSTTLLSPEQYGLLALLIAFQMFHGLFLINPIAQHINRNTHAWAEDGSLLVRLHQYRLYVLAIGGVGALTTGLWTLSRSVENGEGLALMLAVAWMIVAVTWNATNIYLLNMLGYRAISVAWTTASIGIGLLASWGLVNIFDLGVAWFYGQAVGMSVGAIGAGKMLRSCLTVTTSSHQQLMTKNDFFYYCLPMAVATGFMWFLLSGYRFQLEYYWGVAALGFAAVGLGLAQQLWGLFETLVMQYLFPLFFRRISGASVIDGQQVFSDMLNTLVPVYLLLLGITVIAAPALVKTLVSDAYSDVVAYVWIGALVEFCRALANLLATALHVTKRMQALILPYAVSAALLIASMSYAGVSGWPLLWAVLALACCYVAMLCLMFWRMRNELPFEIDWLRWGGAASITLLVVMFAQAMPMHVPSVGYALIFLAILLVAAGIIFGALMWRNPAVGRMLAVKLRDGG